MEPVTLKALFHRSMEYIGIYYARNSSLEKIIRKQPNVKWSKTNACWYIPLLADAYQKLMQDLNGKVVVDNSSLRTYLEQRKKVAPTIVGKKPSAEKASRTVAPRIDMAAMNLSAENTEALRKFVEILNFTDIQKNLISIKIRTDR